MLQKTAEYALRTVVWMAIHPDRAVTSREIAEGTKTPARYLYKVLQALAKSGLVRSQPGPGGGYRLLCDPEATTLFDVVGAIGPVERIRTCPLGLQSHQELCPLHRHLDNAYAGLEQALSRVTVGEVARSQGPFMTFIEASP